MRSSIMALAMALVTGTGFAQRFTMDEVNTETPEGKAQQEIGTESDPAKKLALMEQFVVKFPKDKSVGWMYEHMQDIYVKNNQYDKIMENSEKLLALDPTYAEVAHQGLKAAEAKKDLELVKKWSGLTWQAANKVATAPQPKAAEEVGAWKERVGWATQVQQYADYALFAQISAAPPDKQADLIQALEAQNPKSQYLPQTVPVLFAAYVQMKAIDKAAALAEKAVESGQASEDMLLFLTNSYFESKKEPAKVHAYAAKVVEVMNAKQKPQGMSDADWENRKTRFLGAAHFISGKLYYTQNSFANADRELRAALPLIANDPQAKPEVLFYLGVANFKMEKVQEAANFNKECAAMKSQFTGLCSKNLAAIRSQYRGVK